MLRGTDHGKEGEMGAFKSESIERCHILTTHITTNKEKHTEKEEEAAISSQLETGQANRIIKMFAVLANNFRYKTVK